MKRLPAWLAERLLNEAPLAELEHLQLEDPALEFLRRQHARDLHAEDDGSGNVTGIPMPEEDCDE